MPKLAKEIMLGFIPVLLVFLVFVGVNIVPLLIAQTCRRLVVYREDEGRHRCRRANERKRKERTCQADVRRNRRAG